jgi:outer membrane protein OmpA-like peptidoglycan-associated protein
MTFVDGFSISGNRVTAADSSLNGAATAINRMLAKIPAGRKRDAALDKVRTDWTWSGAADPRITTWMAGYRSSVQGAWSSAGTGLSFKSTHTGWESQVANVNVVVNTTNVTAPAGGGAAPAAGPTPTHTQARIFKTADDNSDFGAAVGPGTAASGTDQTLDLGSGQTTARSRLLHQEVQFGNNSDTLDAAGKGFLNQFIVTFQAPAGGTGTTLDITGHASSTGDNTPAGQRHNQELSEKRAQSVADYLKTATVGGQSLRNAAARVKSTVGAGTTGATEDAAWRKVDIDVAGGQAQNIAAHEFGHMLGLDDEYSTGAGSLITGTGNPVGTPTATNGSATGQGLPGSVAENNDNIMSLGSTVRPQHYTTFMEALRTVTGSTEWKI